MTEPTERAGGVREALEGFRKIAPAVMSALMATRGRDDLLLADQVHRADTAARIALSPPAAPADGSEPLRMLVDRDRLREQIASEPDIGDYPAPAEGAVKVKEGEQ